MSFIPAPALVTCDICGIRVLMEPPNPLPDTLTACTDWWRAEAKALADRCQYAQTTLHYGTRIVVGVEWVTLG